MDSQKVATELLRIAKELTGTSPDMSRALAAAFKLINSTESKLESLMFDIIKGKKSIDKDDKIGNSKLTDVASDATQYMSKAIDDLKNASRAISVLQQGINEAEIARRRPFDKRSPR